MALILNKRKQSSINRILRELITGFPTIVTENKSILSSYYRQHLAEYQKTKTDKKIITQINSYHCAYPFVERERYEAIITNHGNEITTSPSSPHNDKLISTEQLHKKNTSNIIKQILDKFPEYISNYLNSISYIFEKRSQNESEFKALEESLSIARPPTGCNTTEKNLEFMKFLE